MYINFNIWYINYHIFQINKLYISVPLIVHYKYFTKCEFVIKRKMEVESCFKSLGNFGLTDF